MLFHQRVTLRRRFRGEEEMTEVGLLFDRINSKVRVCFEFASSIRDTRANELIVVRKDDWNIVLRPEKNARACTMIDRNDVLVKVYWSNRGRPYVSIYRGSVFIKKLYNDDYDRFISILSRLGVDRRVARDLADYIYIYMME